MIQAILDLVFIRSENKEIDTIKGSLKEETFNIQFKLIKAKDLKITLHFPFYSFIISAHCLICIFLPHKITKQVID